MAERSPLTTVLPVSYNSLMAATYEDGIREWRHSLDDSLRRPFGWLALAGLHWLEEGTATLGASPSCDHVLPPVAPERLGTVELEAGEVTFRASDGLEVQVDGQPAQRAVLKPDISGSPTMVEVGPLRLMVIVRDELIGLRVWDSSRSARRSFPGRRWFPIEPSARVDARWFPDDGSSMIFPNELGQTTDEPIAGRIHIELQGTEANLAALPTDNGELFLIFADATTGGETYSGGRYLMIPPPEGELAIVDFNRAYNPPCAFTSFATCTLPPAVNRLDIPIRAGELAPAAPGKYPERADSQEPPPVKR
jgi:uncharacterized protein (DUF1684 family)